MKQSKFVIYALLVVLVALLITNMTNVVISNIYNVETKGDCGHSDYCFHNDLYAEVLSPPVPNGGVNILSRITTYGGGFALFIATSLRDVNNYRYNKVSENQRGTMAFLAKPQTHYYIYTLCRLRI